MNDCNMTDAKPELEMREIINRVKARSRKDGVGLYEAMKRENVPKTTYYAYKDRLELLDKMELIQPQVSSGIPEIPNTPMEELRIPGKQKYHAERHRISIDLPHDVFEYVDKEHIESTFSVKSICQKIVIDYVRDKKIGGQKLFP
jgi:hypothetical protein